MKLRSFLESLKKDIDTGDTKYDIIVTTCYIQPDEFEKYTKPADGDKNYYRFVRYVYNNVDVSESDANCCVCDWTGFVTVHKAPLMLFMKNCWEKQFGNDDFEYQWIKEIHYFLAGYASEAEYETLLDYFKDSGFNTDSKNPVEKSQLYALMETTCDTGGVYESTVIVVSNNLDYLKTKMKDMVDKDYHNGGDFYTAGIDKKRSNEMKTVSWGSTAYEIVKTELVNFVEV